MHTLERDDDLQILGLYHGASAHCLSLIQRSYDFPSLSPWTIQREDLEFSVGSKATVWEVKDPLLAGHEYEEETASTYHDGRTSLVGGVSGKNLYSKSGYGGRGYPPSSERY